MAEWWLEPTAHEQNPEFVLYVIYKFFALRPQERRGPILIITIPLHRSSTSSCKDCVMGGWLRAGGKVV